MVILVIFDVVGDVADWNRWYSCWSLPSGHWSSSPPHISAANPYMVARSSFRLVHLSAKSSWYIIWSHVMPQQRAWVAFSFRVSNLSDSLLWWKPGMKLVTIPSEMMKIFRLQRIQNRAPRVNAMQRVNAEGQCRYTNAATQSGNQIIVNHRNVYLPSQCL